MDVYLHFSVWMCGSKNKFLVVLRHPEGYDLCITTKQQKQHQRTLRPPYAANVNVKIPISYHTDVCNRVVSLKRITSSETPRRDVDGKERGSCAEAPQVEQLRRNLTSRIALHVPLRHVQTCHVMWCFSPSSCVLLVSALTSVVEKSRYRT
jgi:hypothetical protein